MGEPLILEVVDHRGRVRQRLRLPRYRFTIGRAYDNDAILDDPYVDGRHLELLVQPDGAVGFRDPGSANGTWEGRTRRSEGVVRPGLALRIGRTTLRFVAATEPVPPALPDAGRTSPLAGLLLDPARAGLIAVVGLGAVALTLELDGSDPISVSNLLAPAAAVTVLAVVWASLWALAGRLVIHRLRFTGHLAWIALVATAGLLVEGALGWLGFLAPGAAPWPIAQGGAELTLASALLAGHLRLATEWPRARRWRVAMATAVVIAVGGTALTWNERQAGGSTPPGFDPVLRPLSARLVPAIAPDAFFRRTDGLVGELDRLAGDEDR